MTDATARTADSFDEVLPAHSAAIYREFSQGRVLLRQVWDLNRAELVDNPLYNVVYNHLGHFRRLYEHLGYELAFHESGGFFYLRELVDEEDDEHDEHALRVQVILLLIGRYFARSGRDLEFLGRPDAGLREADLEAMGAEEEYLDILRTARIDKGWPEAMEYLARRHFLFRSGAERYFLSSAGMAFLHQLVREYQASEQGWREAAQGEGDEAG